MNSCIISNAASVPLVSYKACTLSEAASVLDSFIIASSGLVSASIVKSSKLPSFIDFCRLSKKFIISGGPWKNKEFSLPVNLETILLILAPTPDIKFLFFWLSKSNLETSSK